MIIAIYNNQIEHDTGRALLIAYPKSSECSGDKFWIPKSLVTDKGYYKKIWIPDNFTLKNINGLDIDHEEIKETFHEQTIRLLGYEEEDNKYYLKVSEPTKIDKEVEIKSELLK